MKSFDVAIYGHLSYDNIFSGFDYKTSVGCMGNVWAQLKTIGPNIRVKLEPTDIGESLILTSTEQCKRTSISRLSLKTRIPTIHDSEISHVMYINELSDTSFISKLSGFVTADVCNGKPLDVTNVNLKHIDLLLLSDEDALINIEGLVSAVRGHVLVHHAAGSTIYSKTTQPKQFKAEFVSNINVLGAGDKFASYIIAGLLVDKPQSIDKVIQDAHNKLTEYFKNEKV